MNSRRLLCMGFFAIFAHGVGFAVRGGILVHWAAEYGFTKSEIGSIVGYGLSGFGVIIILGGLFADRVGYGRLMVAGVVLQVVSALLQLCTHWAYTGFGEGEAGRWAVDWTLSMAMFLFSIANGICEVVVNPMVATLFPKNKTHYLNMVHAGWPGGMVVGGVLSYVMNIYHVHWMVQMSLFLIPVAIYAVLMIGQHLPRSEAGEAGVRFWAMLAEFAAPVLLLLLVIQALVGYVELGSESWMQDILNRVMGGRSGNLIFIYCSILMFVLRFLAGPIERRLSPLGLLFFCSVIAGVGLALFGCAPTQSWGVFVLAATVFAAGTTFIWPTMLAVVSERFPRGGAVTMGMIGGVGMLSAGFLGSPIIGFQQDYYGTQDIEKKKPDVYERYAAEKPKSFPLHLLNLDVKALDAQKTGLLEFYNQMNRTEDARMRADMEKVYRKTLEDEPIAAWWRHNVQSADKDLKPIDAALIHGGQMAFLLTALVPATSAVLYLLLIVYFKMTGGYKRLALEPHAPHDAQ